VVTLQEVALGLHKVAGVYHGVWYLMIRTMVSFEPGNYQDWQVELLAYTHRKVGQEGPLTALASVKSGAKLKDYGIEVIRTRWMSKHPLTKDHYPPYNKPASFCDYFSITPYRGEMLLLVDPDMVFVKPWDHSGDVSVAEETAYMRPECGRNVIKRHCKRNADKVQPVGFPLIIAEEEFRSITDRWYILTEEMRGNKLTCKEVNWVVEMWAFSVAAAECGISFQVERRCSFSNENLNPSHSLIHYTYPTTSKSGFLWDKRQYKPWSPMPKLKSDVPTAGETLHQIIEEYRVLI
jgi:hypothetical protein